MPGRPLVEHELAGCSLEIAVHLEELEEAALGRQPLEVGAAHEVVVDAVDLAGPARARRPRNRPVQARVPFPQQPPDRSLPGSGRAGQDEQDALGYGVPPSRLR